MIEARNRTLPRWFEIIRNRQIMLPRFQRFEAWDHQRVSGLLETVINGLPAGAVLILEVGETEKFLSRPIVGAPNSGDRIIEHLLDGQQRFTALWRSLTDHYPDRSYFLWLEEDEEGADHQIWSCGRYMKDGKKYPIWADDPAKVWEKKMMPIHLFCPGSDGEVALKEWAKTASSSDTDMLLEIIEVGNKYRQLFAEFNIPFLSLPSSTPADTALNVFVQMNTSSAPLDAYDIVVAQVEAATSQSLHDMTDELTLHVPNLHHYTTPRNFLLQVSALLQDKTATRSTFLDGEFSSKLVDNWDELKSGTKKAITFLEEEKVFDAKRLPTDVCLAPLAALWASVREGLDEEGEARSVLRKYLWRTFFTDRYEKTSATRALVDYRQLTKWLNGERDITPLIFDDVEFPLPAKEEFLSAGWPTRKDRLPRALLGLSLKAGGLDFADSTPAGRDHLGKREYHHLFPIAYLKDSYTDTEIYRALNCALITWKTNRNISSKSPEKYINERIAGSTIGEAEVQRRIESHLIPWDEIKGGDYEAYLKKRAEWMHEEMLKLCSMEAAN